MSSAVTPDQAIANYRDAYKDFFGCEAPQVRKRESGGFSVLFEDGSKRYSKASFAAVTGMMIELKDEVF